MARTINHKYKYVIQYRVMPFWWTDSSAGGYDDKDRAIEHVRKLEAISSVLKYRVKETK